MRAFRVFALLYGLMAFPAAMVLHEVGQKDIGAFVLIGAGILGIIAVPLGPFMATAKSIPLAEPAEVIQRHEVHRFEHHIHHNLSYGTVTEGSEISRELPDGTVIRQKLIRRWE